MSTENIQKFLMPPDEGGAYTDEKLAALLAHAQDGKLSFLSCCCLIGIPTANHALQGETDHHVEHWDAANSLPFAAGAQHEFLRLPDKGKQYLRDSDAQRRERLIPLILAEMERRDQKRPKIDARNGCYGNEEATADDGVQEVSCGVGKVPEPTGAVGDGIVIPGGSDERTWPRHIATPPAGKYDGNLLPAMTAMVTGFVDKLAKFYSPCPQGDDCAGDQKHNRLFACDHCSFVGCCACMDSHEAEAHWTDSDTAREMHR